MKYFSAVPIMALVAGFSLQAPASAQTVTGTIDATITLTSACEVNGSTSTASVAFGTLDFGTQTTLFTEADAQVNGNGSGQIAVQCSPGADATLTINSGSNDAELPEAGRALSNGSLFVPYDIYSDPGFADVLANGSTIPITANGTVQLIPVYGKALGVSGLVADTYTDTIAVTLAF